MSRNQKVKVHVDIPFYTNLPSGGTCFVCEHPGRLSPPLPGPLPCLLLNLFGHSAWADRMYGYKCSSVLHSCWECKFVSLVLRYGEDFFKK